MRSQNRVLGFARNACSQCRKSKRKCDKVLPSCGLCTRREVNCTYSTRQSLSLDQQVTSDSNYSASFSLSPSYSGPHDASAASSSSVSSKDNHYMANAVYFISPRLHLQAQLEFSRPSLPIPSQVAFLFADASSIRSTASSFFSTLHRWLPIISKRVFYTCLLNPLAERQTELTLLALSMKLCCTVPTQEAGESAVKTELYYTTKRYLYEVDNAGFLSIHVLQASILLALYELGQAIYPAAYLTVGACARYALALGIDKFTLVSTLDAYGSLSWNEIEERRRVWWAVVMLDRFLSLGNPKRPLSTEDPTFDSYLPVDDDAWDDCTAKPTDAALLSTGFTLKMGPFARLSQGTFLLSQALRFMRLGAAEDGVACPDKTAQLRRTLLALVHAADAEATARKLEFCAQSGLSLSTILLLQEQELSIGREYGYSRVSREDLWPETRTALDRLSAAATSHLSNSPHDPYTSDSLPICMIHVMFQAAYTLLTLGPEYLRPQIRKEMEVFRRVLQLIDLRWRLAGVYLKVLDIHEIAISADATGAVPKFA